MPVHGTRTWYSFKKDQGEQGVKRIITREDFSDPDLGQAAI
jgi:hypothetical protein